jgi:hypothetical protein
MFHQKNNEIFKIDSYFFSILQINSSEFNFVEIVIIIIIHIFHSIQMFEMKYKYLIFQNKIKKLNFENLKSFKIIIFESKDV